MGPTRIRPSAGLVGLVAAAFWALAAADVVAQGSEESDRAALAALYDATGGAGWANSTNWRTSAPLGEWYGVSAGSERPGHGTEPQQQRLGGFDRA